MHSGHLALLGIAVCLCAAVVGATQQPRNPKPTLPAIANQLAIVNDQGEPVGSCPLKHTAVNADIAGFVARVTVRQEFHNPSTEPIEAIYTFPLPADSAVDDMTMTIGARVVKGQIKRREEARAIYEAARAAGQAASLLDQERPNIFTQSVANIMPGEQVTITLSYVNLLNYDDGRYEFAFPTVVGPRYTPEGGYYAPGQRGHPSPQRRIQGDPGRNPVVRDADKITPPITPQGTRAGHDISLSVNLDAGLPLQEITSVLHPITVNRTGSTRATVRLRQEKTLPNKDFILRYTVGGDKIQTGVLAHRPDQGTGYFTLILQPPVAPPQEQVSPKEMVFVIDQSGSQHGWPIQKAKETMRFCIRSLNNGDTFQLLGFNTRLNPCFPKPVPATPQNIEKALAFLAPIEGQGGTDILQAVDYALKLPDDPGRLRIICYMTDGYVGNDMQILDYVRKHRGRARMFPFGMGNGVNRFLIDGMAREGRGTADYVTLDEPGKEAAERFYQRIANPLLLDVKVEWNGLPVEDVYPTVLPDLFSAGPVILKGRYTRAVAGEITVRGLLRGRPWSQKIAVQFPAERKEGAAIATLWARERIEDLQARDWLGAQTGNPDPEITDQIIALALDYRLMSQYTSFVAVEEKVINIGGRQRTIDVPIEMPEGVSYEGIFGERIDQRLHLLNSAGPPAIGRAAPYGGGYGGFGGPGGFGGTAGAARGPAGPAGPPASQPAGRARGRMPRISGQLNVPLRGSRVTDEPLPGQHPYRDIAEGTPEGLKQLEAMKPEERRALLIEVKLDPRLHNLAERLQKEGRDGNLHVPGGPDVDSGRVAVQIWLNRLPEDGLQQLRALGFELAATLRPNRLLVGTVSVEKLESLLGLPFVRFVDPLRFK